MHRSRSRRRANPRHVPVAYQIRGWLMPFLEQYRVGHDVSTYTAKKWGQLQEEGGVEESPPFGPAMGQVATFIIPDLATAMHGQAPPTLVGVEAAEIVSGFNELVEAHGFEWSWNPNLRAFYFYEER